MRCHRQSLTAATGDKRPSSRKDGVARAECLHGIWVDALSRDVSFGAHGSTGKPEPAFQSAENALTVQDHIRGVRRSGPHEVLRMQDKVRNKLTKRQYENGSELVDVDVARAAVTAPSRWRCT